MAIECWAPANNPDLYIRTMAIDLLDSFDVELDVTYTEDSDGLVLAVGRAWTHASAPAS